MQVQLTINGRAVTADVEPRQHLADFLREEMLLTGTHLGCEHGVCGACTVLIDGAPARSCISFPVALDGVSIRTIEDFGEDAVMVQLREAFSAEHGLQCGFCTPGMLVMARDIVLRRPGADMDVIRHELAGNLCRCTGYLGILRAVRRVAAQRAGEAPVATRGTPAAAASAPDAGLPLPGMRSAAPSLPSKSDEAAVQAKSGADARPLSGEDLRGGVTIAQQFRLAATRPEVWSLFRDPERVVGCLPGARLAGPSDGRTIAAEVTVKLGPIQGQFAGAGVLSLDRANWSGTVEGTGLDHRTSTRVRARLAFRLAEAEEARATDAFLDVTYALQGPLAQVSRGALARDLADRITRSFAANVEAALNGGAVPKASASLNAGALFLAAAKAWISRLFRSRRDH